MTRNILVLYYLPTAKLKPTTAEHMYAFQRHAQARCFYVNLYAWSVPHMLALVSFDLIVFDYSVMDRRRSGTTAWEGIQKRAQVIKQWGGVRIAVPQDECNYTDRLRDFIREFDIDFVCSVAQPSQWPVIYKGVDFERTQFVEVLTGYLDQKSVQRINKLAQTSGERSIDVGYRTAYRPEWGRFGLYKVKLAEVFGAKSKDYGLTVDISTDSTDFYLGDDWYRFLLRCKYTPGVESGGSLLDRDGSVTSRIRRYGQVHPEATFDEVETACFDGLDNSVDLRALAPRHLEACVTRTCQVLVEGDYNGVLLPWSHYLPLKADLSNIDEVMQVIKEDKMRATIVESAYRDVVESGKYTYTRYVNDVLEHTLKGRSQAHRPGYHRIMETAIHVWIRIMEGFALPLLHVRDVILRFAPPAILTGIRRVKNLNTRE